MTQLLFNGGADPHLPFLALRVLKPAPAAVADAGRCCCCCCCCGGLLHYFAEFNSEKMRNRADRNCHASKQLTRTSDGESSISRVTFTFLVKQIGREILLSSETTSLAEQRWKPKKCGMEESVFSIIWSGVPAAAAEAGAGGEGEGGGAQACQGTCQDTCMRPSCGCTLKL